MCHPEVAREMKHKYEYFSIFVTRAITLGEQMACWFSELRAVCDVR